jgi:hypothetical protein
MLFSPWVAWFTHRHQTKDSSAFRASFSTLRDEITLL